MKRFKLIICLNNKISITVGIIFILGSGSAITSVLSLSVTANLIGNDTHCGAFIYSAVTFSDKLINGLVIVGIELM